MDTKYLEIHEFTGIGYKPLIDYGTWRVAILRYIDELDPDRIERVERHNETDEVFVLLEGQALLFMGEGDSQITALKPVRMQPLKQYNVRRGAWHTSVLSRDASILLVENKNTGKENTDYQPLDDAFRKIIIDESAREIPADWAV